MEQTFKPIPFSNHDYNEEFKGELNQMLRDLNDIKDISLDIRNLLGEQGEQLDQIDNKVDDTQENISKSRKQLSKIEEYVKSSSTKKLILAAILGGCLIPIAGIKVGIPVFVGSYVASRL